MNPLTLLNSWKLKAVSALLLISIFAFLTYRVYDIGGDRREKSVRTEWALENKAKADAAEKDRIQKQAESDQIDRERSAEYDNLKKIAQDLAEKLNNERKKSSYRCRVPDSGVQLYNDAVRRPAAKQSASNR